MRRSRRQSRHSSAVAEVVEVGSSSLGSHRLTARGAENRPTESPSVGQTAFGEQLDYDKLELTGEIEYRAVAEGDTKRVATVSEGIEALDEYRSNKENASLVLEEKETEEVRVLPYNHRWTSEYRSMLYARLKEAERCLERKYGDPIPTTLLSLTAHQTDENGEPRPPGKVLDDLVDGWEKFRKAIDRATEGFDTEYIKVIEPHESGYPHLHVAIFGKADPTLADKIQELWVEKYGIGNSEAHENAVSVGRGRSAQLQSMASYVMKYLSKTTVRQSGEKQQVEGYHAFSALLWVTGKRQFSMSGWLSEASSRSYEGGVSRNWRFVGVGYGFEQGSYGGETAREIVEYLERSVWKPPPHEATVEYTGQKSLPVRG